MINLTKSVALVCLSLSSGFKCRIMADQVGILILVVGIRHEFLGSARLGLCLLLLLTPPLKSPIKKPRQDTQSIHLFGEPLLDFFIPRLSPSSSGEFIFARCVLLPINSHVTIDPIGSKRVREKARSLCNLVTAKSRVKCHEERDCEHFT